MSDSGFFDHNNGQGNDDPPFPWDPNAPIDNFDSSPDDNFLDTINPTAASAQLTGSTAQDNLLPAYPFDQIQNGWSNLPDFDENVRLDFDEYQPHNSTDFFSDLTMPLPEGDTLSGLGSLDTRTSLVDPILQNNDDNLDAPTSKPLSSVQPEHASDDLNFIPTLEEPRHPAEQGLQQNYLTPAVNGLGSAVHHARFRSVDSTVQIPDWNQLMQPLARASAGPQTQHPLKHGGCRRARSAVGQQLQPQASQPLLQTTFQEGNPSDEQSAQENQFDTLFLSNGPLPVGHSAIPPGPIASRGSAGENAVNRETESHAGLNAVTDNRLALPESNGARAILLKPLVSLANTATAPTILMAPVASTELPAASGPPKATTKKPSAAKGKQEAVKVPIYKAELLVTSLDEAKKEAIKLIKLQVDADDRASVASHPEIWVPRIAKAFDSDVKAQPDDETTFTADGKTEWTRWQTEHENKVWSILSGSEDPSKRVQSCAYIFYQKVVDAHKDGNGLQYVAKTIANGGPNTNLKCSERIEAAIKALEEYSIVRYDLLMLNRLEGLAASPEGFIHRKVENMWVNYKKKADAKPIKIEITEEDEDTAKGKKGKKGKKRKATETPAVDDNDDDADDDAAAGPVRKKVKTSSKNN